MCESELISHAFHRSRDASNTYHTASYSTFSTHQQSLRLLLDFNLLKQSRTEATRLSTLATQER